MNKLKTFFRTYTKSISEPAYYNQILKAKFSFSMKYFLAFYFLFSLVSSTIYNFTTKPKLFDLSSSVVDEITSNYPTDLVITINNSGLTMEGGEDPLYIPIPAFLQGSGLEEEFDYLATITNSPETPTANSLITANKNEIVVRTPDGTKETVTYKSLELSDDQSIVLNKNIINISTSQFKTIIDQIITFSPIGIFLLNLVFLPAVTALGLLFNTLITWLIASVMGKNLSYGQSYQIGLHTATFASTAQLIKDILFPAVSLSALSTIAFFGSAIIALMAIKPFPKKS